MIIEPGFRPSSLQLMPRRLNVVRARASDQAPTRGRNLGQAGSHIGVCGSALIDGEVPLGEGVDPSGRPRGAVVGRRLAKVLSFPRSPRQVDVGGDNNKLRRRCVSFTIFN